MNSRKSIVPIGQFIFCISGILIISALSILILHFGIGDRFKPLFNGVDDFMYYAYLLAFLWASFCVLFIINVHTANPLPLRRALGMGALLGYAAGYFSCILYMVMRPPRLPLRRTLLFPLEFEFPQNVEFWISRAFLLAVVPILFTKTWLAGMMTGASLLGIQKCWHAYHRRKSSN